MKLKKRKIYLNDLMTNDLSSADMETVLVMRDIVDSVECLHNLSERKLSEDGQFAKVYADMVSDRMESIFKLANEHIRAIIKG